MPERALVDASVVNLLNADQSFNAAANHLKQIGMHLGTVNWFKNIFGSKEKEPDVLIKPPFPPLTRDVFGDGSLFHWRGQVHLKSWTGFAAERDLTLDGWEPPDPRPDGLLSLCVDPFSMAAGTEPTSEQAQAFQHLLENEKAIRDAVLEGIFKDYPDWRKSY